jgi:hypothetical protein
MADHILDRDQHPEWNGERTKMVYSFPTNEKLWQRYAEMRADSMRHGNSGEEATAFYRQNREAMDEGSLVAWPSASTTMNFRPSSTRSISSCRMKPHFSPNTKTNRCPSTWLQAVVRGYFNYHAIPGNIAALEAFRTQAVRSWLFALPRRSQRSRMVWERFGKFTCGNSNRWRLSPTGASSEKCGASWRGPPTSSHEGAQDLN